MLHSPNDVPSSEGGAAHEEDEVKIDLEEEDGEDEKERYYRAQGITKTGESEKGRRRPPRRPLPRIGGSGCVDVVTRVSIGRSEWPASMD